MAEKRGVSQNTLMIESIRRQLIDLETEIFKRGYDQGYEDGYAAGKAESGEK